MALCNNKLYIIIYIYIYIMFSHIVPGVLQDANIILNKKMPMAPKGRHYVC